MIIEKQPMRKNITLLLLLLTYIPMYSFGQNKNIHTQLEEIAHKHKAIGLTVAVVKDNKVIYNHALGYSDLNKAEKMTTDHVFRIASISKSFTATALMQLIEEGKLSLEDDFSDLIGFKVRNPHYPDDVITLEMVLSHSSSINDKNGYFTLDVIDPQKNEEWEACYNDYKPGSQYEYCNLNFNMAGAVIERITGNRFDKEIKKRVLEPLGLKAGYDVDELKQNRFAKLYSYDKSKSKFIVQPDAYSSPQKYFNDYELGRSAPIFSPTGGMKISTNDLTKYMLMHMNYGSWKDATIISAESARVMQNPVISTKYGGYGLALTQNTTIIPTENMVGHTGDAYGLYSNMYFEPENKFGFVVITNGCEAHYDSNENMLFSKEVINFLYDYFIAR